jgi:hypothetical protein
MFRVFVHFFAKHQQVLGKTSACFQNPFYDIMNEELNDIKGSFFSKIGLYRNFIQYSMQQSLFNTIYILCKKIKLKKSSISLQKGIDDFIF